MKIPMGTTMEMRFPLLQDFLPTILSCCRETSGLFGFSREDSLRLEIAMEEALTAIISGETDAPEKKSEAAAPLASTRRSVSAESPSVFGWSSAISTPRSTERAWTVLAGGRA